MSIWQRFTCALALGLAACATTPIPADKLSRSNAAIKSAEALDAQRDPNAAAHYQLAKEQLASGKKLLQDGETKRAARVLDRAEADAIAARELARAKASRIEVEQTKVNVQREMTAIGGGMQ